MRTRGKVWGAQVPILRSLVHEVVQRLQTLGRTLRRNLGNVRAPSRRALADGPEPGGGARSASPGSITGRNRMKSKEKYEEDKE